MTCNRWQSWMMEALYGELDQTRRVEFDAHVAGCADCAALLSQLQTTALLMSRRRRPDPGPEFWAGYQRRLEQRVAREDAVFVDASRFARRRSLGSWGYRVAAVVALFAAGAWMGRTVLAPSQPETSMLATTQADSTPRGRSSPTPVDDGVASEAPMVAEASRETTPLPIDAPRGGEKRADDREGESTVLASSGDEAQRYIERSQMVLLAMLNGDPADSVAFDVQRQRAGELVRVASLVRESSDDRRVRELIAQLELILREIAHLEQSSDVDAVELIRSRVDREGVLLRINVEQMRSATPRATSGAID